MGHCKFHVTPGHQQTLPRAMEAFPKDCGGREGGVKTLECRRDVTSGEANEKAPWSGCLPALPKQSQGLGVSDVLLMSGTRRRAAPLPTSSSDSVAWLSGHYKIKLAKFPTSKSLYTECAASAIFPHLVHKAEVWV